MENLVNSSVTMHKTQSAVTYGRDLQTKNELNPTFMQDISAEKDNYYNLCNLIHLHSLVPNIDVPPAN